LGVILACSFTFTTNVLGLLCALGSCLVFVLQNVFSKKLLFQDSGMHSRRADKLDKLNLLFYSSLLAFVLMTPLWLTSDGYVILASLFGGQAPPQGSLSSSVLIGFLLNGIMHFGQNWCAFTTLSLTSPVTYSIASLVKRIFVIVASIIWFGQQVSFIQTFGILLTFIGLWMYQSAKQDVDRGESKVREKSLGGTLPTSQMDRRSSYDANTTNFGWNDFNRQVQRVGRSIFSRIKRQPTPDLGVKSL
jgi:drug/metabolite transporter (DMT)-like permease